MSPEHNHRLSAILGLSGLHALGGATVQIVASLLTKDPTERLGNTIGDLEAHPFFKELDWDALKYKTLAAPWVPPLPLEM